MLFSAEGCDATITRDRFEIRFGWHPARHKYFLSIAPAVVSKLLELSGQTPSAGSVRARIGPAEIPRTQFPKWSFEARYLWIDLSDEQISISVRECSAINDAVAPPLLPEPAAIQYERRYLSFSPELECPHCRVPDASYRQISCGSLVCQACGRSFDLHEDDTLRAARR
jgi:hypothetical protein